MMPRHAPVAVGDTVYVPVQVLVPTPSPLGPEVPDLPGAGPSFDAIPGYRLSTVERVVGRGCLLRDELGRLTFAEWGSFEANP